jgi:hypothetical protein
MAALRGPAESDHISSSFNEGTSSSFSSVNVKPLTAAQTSSALSMECSIGDGGASEAFKELTELKE